MFLFPWLDWGIDISDFEKIDFLGHERFLAFSAPWKRDFLTLGPIFRAPLGGNRGTDPPGGGGWGGVRGGSGSKNQMVFRTQRTLSENILMICDPLPVKFWPQKNCWFGPKIALFSVVNCPGAKNGVIKNFCCTKKWPRRGQKIKIFFFRKNIRKMGKKIWGPLGP